MISVILASHNGEETLPAMLEAFCALRGHASAVEILVVDNASTDNTAGIIKSYAGKLPIKYLYCGKRGKNAALNCALKESAGELIVLTDDDIVPYPDWLLEYENVARALPDIALFGGRIEPLWLAPPPAWIQALDLGFGCHPASMQEGFGDPATIWGGNMMVRRCVFESGMRFNDDIGPNSDDYPMGSEVDFNARVVARGFGCYLSNRPRVRHVIKKQQLDRKWLLKRAICFGRGQCVITYDNDRTERRVLGVPRWRLRELVKNYVRAVLRGAWFGSTASFPYLWKVKTHIGYLRQFRWLSAPGRPGAFGREANERESV